MVFRCCHSSREVFDNNENDGTDFSQIDHSPGLCRRYHPRSLSPPVVSAATGIHTSVVVDDFLYSRRCDHRGGDTTESISSDTVVRTGIPCECECIPLPSSLSIFLFTVGFPLFSFCGGLHGFGKLGDPTYPLIHIPGGVQRLTVTFTIIGESVM